MGTEQQQAAEKLQVIGQPARVFEEFHYETRESWSRPRRAVAQVEHLEKGANLRLMVTSLGREQWEVRSLI